MQYLKIGLLLTVVCFYTEYARAQIDTDRPDQTESSSVIPDGALQIESGLLVSYTEGTGGSSVRQFLIPTNLFRFSITKGIELRFVSNWETGKIDDVTFDGISDLEIGTKVQLFKKENSNTEVAFLAHLIVPTGTPFFSIEDYGLFSRFLISHQLADDINLGYNIGYNYLSNDNGDLTYTLALAVDVNERVGVYIEPFGELTNMQDFMLNADAGFTYLINPNFQLDFSFGTGINNQMNYISLGASVLFEKS